MRRKCLTHKKTAGKPLFNTRHRTAPLFSLAMGPWAPRLARLHAFTAFTLVAHDPAMSCLVSGEVTTH